MNFQLVKCVGWMFKEKLTLPVTSASGKPLYAHRRKSVWLSSWFLLPQLPESQPQACWLVERREEEGEKLKAKEEEWEIEERLTEEWGRGRGKGEGRRNLSNIPTSPAFSAPSLSNCRINWWKKGPAAIFFTIPETITMRNFILFAMHFNYFIWSYKGEVAPLFLFAAPRPLLPLLKVSRS